MKKLQKLSIQKIQEKNFECQKWSEKLTQQTINKEKMSKIYEQNINEGKLPKN